MSDTIIIKSGFQAIKASDLRSSSLTKGKNLCQSGHVKNVEEWQSGDINIIKAKVIRQTSIKLHFNVTIEVDVNRNIIDRRCDCPAGLGKNCKHISAVIHFINIESAKSKTSLRCQWNAPTVSRDNEAYSKGRKISELFPQKVPDKYHEPVHIPDLNFSCPLGDILKASNLTESIKAAKTIINEIIDSAINITSVNVCLHLCDYFHEYHLSSQVYYGNSAFQEIFHEYFYENNVIRSHQNLAHICAKTQSQSECKEWFNEREIRVSASTAHNIKTRRSKFDELADTMISEKKLKGKALRNVSYGMINEDVARELYKTQTGYQVLECGLVIHPSQPWLCASPDGIIVIDGKPAKILEIKCPITIKNDPIINNEGKLNLSYLEFTNDNTISLKKSHSYYTQCQILMYCTSLPECDFLVYSPNFDSIFLTIPRDDKFLSENIPKLENFFVKYYIRKLIIKYGL